MPCGMTDGRAAPMFPEAPPSGGQSERFPSFRGCRRLQIVFFLPLPPPPPPTPPTASLSRKQRQKHAHPSARNRLAFPRYRKSSDKLPGWRSVTAAPPPGRQCAVTTCWKPAEKKHVRRRFGPNIRAQCCKQLTALQHGT